MKRKPVKNKQKLQRQTRFMQKLYKAVTNAQEGHIVDADEVFKKLGI